MNEIPVPSELNIKECKASEAAAFSSEQVQQRLGSLTGWELAGEEIARTYNFKNYFEVIAFVNAVAWISHQENHHPDMEVGFKKCRVRYSTHAVGGLTEYDFACAARVDALLKA